MGDGEAGYDLPREDEEKDDGYCQECGKRIALSWNDWDGKCLSCEKRLQFAEELGDEEQFNTGSTNETNEVRK